MENVRDVLDRLERVRLGSQGWTARCPAHPDRNPSLSIRVLGGRVRLHCFTGCSEEAIRAALRLPPLGTVGTVTLPPPLMLVGPRGPRYSPSFWDAVRRQAIAIYRASWRAFARDEQADTARALRREILALRAEATKMGDTEEAWEILSECARAEAILLAWESEP